MTRLYLELVGLGMEYRNGRVHLPDLDDITRRPKIYTEH